MRRTKTFVIALATVVATSAAALAATAQDSAMSVQRDESRRVQLRGAAESIIVGNPQIADVTVVDANTLYITGKGNGVTEVIAVGASGRTVFQSQVVVTEGGAGRVRVWRGAQATEMACAESCAPTLRANGSSSAAPAAMP